MSDSKSISISTIAVVGAGQMGSGIAQVSAATGLSVVLCDLFSDTLSRAKINIEKNIYKQVEKGRIDDAAAKSQLSRIHFTHHIEEVSRADLVVEAIVENPSSKFELFVSLDKICNENTILASNTSSISITDLAARSKRPDRVVGMHFMNPVPVMKLVEVIRGLRTSQETFESVRSLCIRMGKQPVESKDYPGFVVNRILMPMINEACFALFEGLASREDIDAAMKLGTNQPMGPLELADFIGLDTCLAIMEVLYDGFGDSKYRPCPILKQYVAAGMLGRKTKQGFYAY